MAELVCTGRAATDTGHPLGEACGRVITARHDLVDVVDQARAAGWAVSDPRPDGGRHAMCPACRKPSTELRQLIRELNR